MASYKILVIDDDTLTRRVLCAALQKMDHTTVEAPTGQVGLHEFRKSQPDVVITDIMMPDKNGLEAIVEMRAANRDVRIIAMSSGGPASKGDVLAIATELGASATIRKPFTVEDITKVLEKVMGAKKS